MRLVFLFTISLLASLCSFLGEARADIVRAYLINPETRYERSSTQDLEDTKPLNFSIGYQYTRWSALLEYSKYKYISGNPTFSVDRTHEEMVMWFRYHAFGWTFGGARNTVQLYGGAGGGGYTESVVTNFNGESRKDSGDIKFMSGLAVGGEYSLRVFGSFVLVSGLEGRALIASDFDPNPMWSAVLRLGVGFIL